MEKSLPGKILEYIIANAPGHVYWKDLNGVYLGCNTAQAKALGYQSGADIAGKTDFDLPWKQEADKLQAIDRQVVSLRKIIEIEEKVTLPNENEAVFLSHKIPLYDKDNIIGILGTSIDITQLKETERNLEKAKFIADSANNEKTEFIAALNNILRSKLNTIALMADLLQKTGLSEKQREYLALLQQANLEIPDDLVYAADYAKLDTGELELFPEEFRLLELVESQANTFHRQARAKGLTFAVNYADLPSIKLTTSVTQLREIIEVIVEQAIEYTQAGGITLYFSESRHQQSHWINIHIEDTSAGYPQDYIDTMFSLVDANKTDTEYPKLSMRIAFCKKMMDKLGGTIAVANNPHGGCTFTLALPVTAVVPLTSAEETRLQRAGVYNYVYIDDNPQQLQTIQSLLGKEAVRITPPHNSPEHLQALITQGEDIDMLLLDEQCVDAHPPLLAALLDSIAGQPILIILLSDETSRYNSTLHTAHQVAVITKPLKWSHFYKQVLTAWEAFNRPVLNTLLVEDNPICQKGTAFALSENHCQVTIAGSGEKAIELVIKEKQAFDVIVLDIGLPGENGLTIANTLHRALGDACPALVALTGLTRKIDLDVLYDSGLFFVVLIKPATLKDMEDILEDIRESVGK